MLFRSDLPGLDFIREAKALGLTLAEIRELVESTQTRSCTMTRPLLLRVLDQRILDTSRQVAMLARLRAKLRRARRALVRRPPTDHRRGYCSCLSRAAPLITTIRQKDDQVGDDTAEAGRDRTITSGRRSAIPFRSPTV